MKKQLFLPVGFSANDDIFFLDMKSLSLHHDVILLNCDFQLPYFLIFGLVAWIC